MIHLNGGKWEEGRLEWRQRQSISLQIFTQAHSHSLAQICKVWPRWVHKIKVLINFYSSQLATSQPAAWRVLTCSRGSRLVSEVLPEHRTILVAWPHPALQPPWALIFCTYLLCLLTAQIHNSSHQPQYLSSPSGKIPLLLTPPWQTNLVWVISQPNGLLSMCVNPTHLYSSRPGPHCLWSGRWMTSSW